MPSILDAAKRSPRMAILCLVSTILIIATATWGVVAYWNTIFVSKPHLSPSQEAIAILNNTEGQPVAQKLPAADIRNTNDAALKKARGSLLGLAVGNAFGAPYEYRTKAQMDAKPAALQMQSSGSAKAGQWTDDTSMALCLAASLLHKNGFDAYDQLARYAWWHNAGYLSCPGRCSAIGASTAKTLKTFEQRRDELAKKLGLPVSSLETDLCITKEQLEAANFNTRCGEPDNAGNGSLMRLAPIPLFYFRNNEDVLKYAEASSVPSHESQVAIDACKLYAALIAGALNGLGRDELMEASFYDSYSKGAHPLCADIASIAQGSYKIEGYDPRIRGTGYVVESLKAALWAFYNDKGKFETGVLLAVNLGGDTDTTAAIYGQLAGAVYGIDAIPEEWRKTVYYSDFIVTLADWLFAMGERRQTA